jgi:hypothetical protein
MRAHFELNEKYNDTIYNYRFKYIVCRSNSYNTTACTCSLTELCSSKVLLARVLQPWLSAYGLIFHLYCKCKWCRLKFLTFKTSWHKAKWGSIMSASLTQQSTLLSAHPSWKKACTIRSPSGLMANSGIRRKSSRLDEKVLKQNDKTLWKGLLTWYNHCCFYQGGWICCTNGQSGEEKLQGQKIQRIINQYPNTCMKWS